MLAIIPANSPVSAKRRLEPLLTADQRAELVRAMLADVIDACNRARRVDRVLVVTPDRSLAPEGAETIHDSGHGHALAIAGVLARCTSPGAVVVMSDCPLVSPDTIDELCAAARPIALCPAQDGGTNALALRPPNAVQPAFGVPGGAAVVLRRARAAGFEPVVIDDPLVALDVDLPEDLVRILEAGSGTRTHALLDRDLSMSAQSGASGR